MPIVKTWGNVVCHLFFLSVLVSTLGFRDELRLGYMMRDHRQNVGKMRCVSIVLFISPSFDFGGSGRAPSWIHDA